MTFLPAFIPMIQVRKENDFPISHSLNGSILVADLCWVRVCCFSTTKCYFRALSAGALGREPFCHAYGSWVGWGCATAIHHPPSVSMPPAETQPMGSPSPRPDSWPSVPGGSPDGFPKYLSPLLFSTTCELQGTVRPQKCKMVTIWIPFTKLAKVRLSHDGFALALSKIRAPEKSKYQAA